MMQKKRGFVSRTYLREVGHAACRD